MDMASPATSSNKNLLGAVAYFGFFATGIILLLIERDNEYVRFHAMQSTILFGGIFIMNAGVAFFPPLGWIIGYFLFLIAFIFWVVLMWKAFTGERYKVPYVGDLAEQQLAKMK